MKHRNTTSASNTALVACSRLVDLAGSEITNIEIAQSFWRLGWKVTVASFELSTRFQNIINNNRFEYIDLSRVDAFKLKASFDIAWIHHSVTAYRVLLDPLIRVKHVVFSSLSHFEPIESPPLTGIRTSKLLVNSQENFNHFIKDYPDLKSDLVIFNNSVPADFFNVAKLEHSSKLEKLVIVSNHIPKEVLDAIPLLKQLGVDIDIYGVSGKQELITPEILLNYDAVLTIGKTVQYCIALQIPVYCYDHFGGNGWVSISTFDNGRVHNFSGRGSRGKVDADRLVEELCEGYSSSIIDLGELYRKGRIYFDLDKNVSSVLESLNEERKILLLSITDRNIVFRQNHSFVQSRSVIANFAQSIHDRDKQIEGLRSLNGAHEVLKSEYAALQERQLSVEQTWKAESLRQVVRHEAKMSRVAKTVQDLQMALQSSEEDRFQQQKNNAILEHEFRTIVCAMHDKFRLMEHAWIEKTAQQEALHKSEKASLIFKLNELQTSLRNTERERIQHLMFAAERERHMLQERAELEREFRSTLSVYQIRQHQMEQAWTEKSGRQDDIHNEEKLQLTTELSVLQTTVRALERQRINEQMIASTLERKMALERTELEREFRMSSVALRTKLEMAEQIRVDTLAKQEAHYEFEMKLMQTKLDEFQHSLLIKTHELNAIVNSFGWRILSFFSRFMRSSTLVEARKNGDILMQEFKEMPVLNSMNVNKKNATTRGK